MTILLAIDDSEFSAAAIKEVVSRPWPPKSTVRVLAAVEPLPLPASELWYGGQRLLETGQRALRKNVSESQRRLR
jgi:hypothetical protein